MVDIVINFRTGIVREYAETDVILDPVQIRNHYLITWFIVDVLSTVPLDYILLAIDEFMPQAARATRAAKLIRFGKILSLLRLLRLSRLIRYVHQWEEIVNMQYDLAIAAIRIFNLIMLMLLIGHWNGCLQYLVPYITADVNKADPKTNPHGFDEDSWIMIDKIDNKPWYEKYREKK